MKPDIVIAAGWVAFWAYWLLAATNAKPGRSRWTRFALVRVAVIAIVIVLIRVTALGGRAISRDPWLLGLGLALFVAGLALAVWARARLGRNWGMPMSQKFDPELVTSGPYRSVRHPIYAGIIVAMIGTALTVNPYLLVMAALLGGYFTYSAVMEERAMTARFPDHYPTYQQSTKMLIPFVF